MVLLLGPFATLTLVSLAFGHREPIAAWGILGSEDGDRREATLGDRSAFNSSLPSCRGDGPLRTTTGATQP
jgi:hypothetical protein